MCASCGDTGKCSLCTRYYEGEGEALPEREQAVKTAGEELGRTERSLDEAKK